MGLLVHIYRDNLSREARPNVFKDVNLLTLINVPGPFNPTVNAPAAEVTRHGMDLVIIPADTMLEPVIGPMFGGTFAYSADSRFPAPTALRIHDRYETPAQYERLSR